jgi:hypothetical protein
MFESKDAINFEGRKERRQAEMGNGKKFLQTKRRPMR